MAGLTAGCRIKQIHLTARGIHAGIMTKHGFPALRVSDVLFTQTQTQTQTQTTCQGIVTTARFHAKVPLDPDISPVSPPNALLRNSPESVDRLLRMSIIIGLAGFVYTDVVIMMQHPLPDHAMSILYHTKMQLLHEARHKAQSPSPSLSLSRSNLHLRSGVD